MEQSANVYKQLTGAEQWQPVATRFGYDFFAHPDCPECHGSGRGKSGRWSYGQPGWVGSCTTCEFWFPQKAVMHVAAKADSLCRELESLLGKYMAKTYGYKRLISKKAFREVTDPNELWLTDANLQALTREWKLAVEAAWQATAAIHYHSATGRK